MAALAHLHRLGRVLAIAAVAMGPTTGCASRFQADGRAPAHAAVGKIRVTVNRTENREVQVTLDHLAPPSHIDQRFEAYAVWFSVPGVGISKAGTIDYDPKRRRGSLIATSPHSKMEVLVTLEAHRNATQPSNVVVLRKLVGRGGTSLFG